MHLRASLRLCRYLQGYPAATQLLHYSAQHRSISVTESFGNAPALWHLKMIRFGPPPAVRAAGDHPWWGYAQVSCGVAMDFQHSATYLDSGFIPN
jgi:hypothetical protein